MLPHLALMCLLAPLTACMPIGEYGEADRAINESQSATLIEDAPDRWVSEIGETTTGNTFIYSQDTATLAGADSEEPAITLTLLEVHTDASCASAAPRNGRLLKLDFEVSTGASYPEIDELELVPENFSFESFDGSELTNMTSLATDQCMEAEDAFPTKLSPVNVPPGQ